MRSYQSTFFSKYRLSLGRPLLLATTSALSLTLVACNQSNVDAFDEQAVKIESPTTIQSLSAQNDEPDLINAPTINKSEVLREVSATVYKDANCGCCKEWVGYAKGNGMNATVQDVADVSLFKDRYGVPQQMRSCHTTVTTNGYVFEGHVPAKHLAQFLANPPNESIGLAVPSMPVGSPGMEYEDKFMPYKVMQLNKDGSTQIYAAIESPAEQS